MRQAKQRPAGPERRIFRYLPSRPVSTAVAVGLTVALGGCASVVSKYPALSGPAAQASRVGQEYFLPKAVLSAEITFEPTVGFALVVSGPSYIGDTEAGVLVMDHVPSPLGADDVTLGVDGNGLLSSVISKTDDRSPEIATGLGKTLGTIESGAASQSVTGAVYFDPMDAKAAAEELTQRMQAWARAARALPKAAAQTDEQKLLNHWLTMAEEGRITVEVKTLNAVAAGTTRTPVYANVDCRPGVCVRGVRPVVVSVKFNGVAVGSAPISIPNGVPPTVVPVNRTLFADRDDTLQFANGMLIKRQVVKGSELEGAVTLIPNFFVGFVDSAVAAIDKRAALATSKFNYEKKKEEVAAAKKKIESGGVVAPALIFARMPGLSAAPGVEFAAPPEASIDAGGSDSGGPTNSTGGTLGSSTGAKKPAS